MKYKNLIVCACLITAFMISGCRSNASESSVMSSEPIRITCEVFYRPGAGMALEAAPEITFAGGNERQAVSYDSLSFEGVFQDDTYEGRALSINITAPQKSSKITSQLYQFDSLNPPENQFIGGHGFTGLVYVFDPESSAEMQYFCSYR